MILAALDMMTWIRIGAVVSVGVAFSVFAFIVIHSIEGGGAKYSENLSAEASRQFEDLFLFIPAKRISDIGKAFAAALFLICFIPFFSLEKPLSSLAGLVLGCLFGFGALRAPSKLVEIMRIRRRKKFNLQLVEALSSMSNALRAGFSINQAFETVVQSGEKPIAQEFGVMLQQMRVGMNFYDAMQSLDKRVGSDDLTLVVTAIDIARRTGGNLTEIFDKIGQTIRERMRIERRVMTLTAQGRLQGLIVALMPVILGILMTAIKPEMMLPFLQSSMGIMSIAVSAGLIVLGWLVIRKIIKIDV
ncbi:MAG: type II secretion system F family protein [Kiritimatiellae bacterium]|nr:type II secretion system F family protein [Kiritimatiellia bacterium]